METTNGPEKLTINDALLRIEEIFGKAMSMGANDSEGGRFHDIEKKLLSGEFTPEEAVSEAQKILDNKQDYH